MYDNIVSAQMSMRDHCVLHSYEDLQEAMDHLENDLEKFKMQYPKWCKENYPLSWATVSCV